MPRLPAKVYHLVDEANWAGVQRDGLLTTATLVRRAGAPAALVQQRRAAGVILADQAFIRDHAPLPPGALERCLDPGLSAADWFEVLANHVFFWAAADRVARHLAAQGSRATRLLTFDAAALAERHGERIVLTPFNLGSARRRAAPRGLRTLVPLDSWRRRSWQAEAAPGAQPRARRHPPAEVLVRGDLPDALDFLLGATPVSSTTIRELL